MKKRNVQRVALVIEDKRWRKDEATLKLIRRASRLALKETAGLHRGEGVTILLADDARLRRLNRQFRGKNKATNVLSFNASESTSLGDIAVARDTVEKEARAQKKSVSAHAAHLVVHGILHLIGYDHAETADAAAMERLETVILSRLGFLGPYPPPPYTQGRKAAQTVAIR